MITREQLFGWLYVLGVLGLAAGCAPRIDINAEQPLPGASTVQKVEFQAEADAGLPVAQADDANRFKTLVKAKSNRWGSVRPDPFALTPVERSFDQLRRVDSAFSLAGGFTLDWTPPDDPADIPLVVEPQPYRRLSGIVVADSVLAIIELGGGRTEIIRPGMTIPDSPWRVISIDPDKAILRRTGDVLPREIVVRLESPPPGMLPFQPGGIPGGVPGGIPGGFPPGGFPGGPPGGFPGGFPGGPPFGGRERDDDGF